MSWEDADYPRQYMIEANDGSNYHFVAEDMYIAKEDFEEKYPDLKIKAIYLEVYNESEDEDDGQPSEREEWHSFDPDC